MSIKDKAMSFAFEQIIGQLQNTGAGAKSTDKAPKVSAGDEIQRLLSQLAEKGGLNPASMEKKVSGKLDGMMDQMAGPISEMAEKALNEKLEEESNR